MGAMGNAAAPSGTMMGGWNRHSKSGREKHGVDVAAGTAAHATEGDIGRDGATDSTCKPRAVDGIFITAAGGRLVLSESLITSHH